MNLPVSLRQSIGQRRILPLVGSSSVSARHRREKASEPSLSRFGQHSSWVESDSERMLPVYEAAAAVADRCVLSLTTDRHLYGVFRASDEHWVLLASGLDRIDEDRKLLIELGGTTGPTADVADADSWPQTRTDSMLWELARSHAARSPLLVVGCDPTDEQVLEAVADLRPNRYFQPTGWLLSSDDSEGARVRWESLGFEVVYGSMPTLLQELREVGAAHRRVLQVAGRRLGQITNPYKYLDAFTR